MHAVPEMARRGHQIPLDLELQMIVSYHTGPETRRAAGLSAAKPSLYPLPPPSPHPTPLFKKRSLCEFPGP